MSDYYNSLAIASMAEGVEPTVECACTALVPADEIVTCEHCGQRGCWNCMVYTPDAGAWYCQHDTDCGAERKAGA
jgi:hypothetical protein